MDYREDLKLWWCCREIGFVDVFKIKKPKSFDLGFVPESRLELPTFGL